MNKYIFFDTETTGFSDEDRIIQIALIIVDKNNIEVLEELCSSTTEIKIDAMATHHITPEMIQDKPSLQETTIYQKLNELNNKNNILIAHNIKFDLNMLEKENFKSQFTLIDTLKCAKHLIKSESYSLQYLRYKLKLYQKEQDETKKYNIQIKAHNALSDVIVLKLLFQYLVDILKKQNLHPIEELIRLSVTPIMIDTFNFGKYKGKKIIDIISYDKGYINWILNNSEDNDLIYSIRKILNAK